MDDLSFDVVVVGCGIAGLSAAVTAQTRGVVATWVRGRAIPMKKREHASVIIIRVVDLGRFRDRSQAPGMLGPRVVLAGAAEELLIIDG